MPKISDLVPKETLLAMHALAGRLKAATKPVEVKGKRAPKKSTPRKNVRS